MMYYHDFGKIVNPQQNDITDFNSQFAPDNPLKVLKPYFGMKDPIGAPQVYVCPSGQPMKKPEYAPTRFSNNNLILSQLVLNKGIEKMRSPSRTVFMQEHYENMNLSGFEAEEPPCS